MNPILIYVFPGLMDVVVSAVLFVSTVRAVDLGFSAPMVGVVLAVNAIVYAASSLLAGWVVTPRNSGRVLVASCLATVVCTACMAAVAFPAAMYVLVAAMGITTAFFFVPFQVFMKAVDQGTAKPLTYSTGLYTFAWSLGYAIGPFISGFLWTHGGWRGTYVFCGAAALVSAVGIGLLKHHADAHPVAAGAGRAASDRGAASRYAAMPDFAWMAWLTGGLGCLTVAVFRSMFPVAAAACDLSKPAQGTVFFVASLAQAVVGLLLVRGRWWMYRRAPLAAFGLSGVAGLAVLACGHGVAAWTIAAVLYGVYTGSFFFYFVFHSLAHPEKSARYLSINEAVVGVAGLSGPLIGGFLTARAGAATAFGAASALVLLAIGIQSVVHRRWTRSSGDQDAKYYSKA